MSEYFLDLRSYYGRFSPLQLSKAEPDRLKRIKTSSEKNIIRNNQLQREKLKSQNKTRSLNKINISMASESTSIGEN